MILLERKGWPLYRRLSELLLSPKEGWRRMKWRLYAKVQRPEERVSSWQEGWSSLPEGEWAVAKPQRGTTQDEVKIVCQGATSWKTGNFLTGGVELFTGGWVNCCWAPKRDDAGWSENCMPRCNALNNRYLLEMKGRTLYRGVNKLLVSPKERWCRMKWKLYAKVQRPKKRASSWEEGLRSLPEGEWAAAES